MRGKAALVLVAGFVSSAVRVLTESMVALGQL
jgi:hypothetical protein